MNIEVFQSELARLQREQQRARQDEVFGGLSATERAAYNTRQDRIHELEHLLHIPVESYIYAHAGVKKKKKS
jgi:hypothetical protein